MPNARCYVYTLPKLLIKNILFPEEGVGKTCLIFTQTCEIWYLVVSYEYKQKVLEKLAMRRAHLGLLLGMLP